MNLETISMNTVIGGGSILKGIYFNSGTNVTSGSLSVSGIPTGAIFKFNGLSSNII